MTRPVVEPHRYQPGCDCNACLALQLRRQNALYGYQPARWRGVAAACWLALVTAAIVAIVLLAAGVITWNPRS